MKEIDKQSFKDAKKLLEELKSNGLIQKNSYIPEKLAPNSDSKALCKKTPITNW